MKDFILIIALACLFSACQKATESETSAHIPAPVTQQTYLDDTDYQEIIRIDQYVQKEIIRGNFNTYRAFLDKELRSKASYCKILATNDLKGELLGFVQAKCDRSKHFKQLISKYPNYLSMTAADKAELKHKALEKMQLELKSEEALEIFKNRKTDTNES